MSDPIFHSGEEFIQEQTGERNIAVRNRGIISNQISPGAANFLMDQKVFFASSMDTKGVLWASVLLSDFGFFNIDQTGELKMNPAFLKSNPQDIFWSNIKNNPGIGLLFIDLMSRRRLRVNGFLKRHDGYWIMNIKQAYPNCPKYIQRRELLSNPAVKESNTEDIKFWIAKADTIFVGSADLDGNLDISHRGGDTGFVKFINEKTLRIPDYVGNSMYNTLGNFHLNPKAAILILDFNSGNTLLSGRAVVHLQESTTENTTGGTHRYWDFKIEKTLFTRSLPDFNSRFIDYSPYNP